MKLLTSVNAHVLFIFPSHYDVFCTSISSAGCFHFHIWRFGEWVDIIVDDYLPVLDDVPLFSKPMGGAACEMWGPLVEKAYAK